MQLAAGAAALTLLSTMATTSTDNVSAHAVIPSHHGDLLPLLQRANLPSKVVKFTPLSSVEQANAEGVRLAVEYEQSGDSSDIDSSKGGKGSACPAAPPVPPPELFVKQVDASHYSHKAWADLRRTLLYARTEARFYGEILPLLRASGKLTTSHLAPDCHLAECNLEGLVGEEETATDVGHVPTALANAQDGSATLPTGDDRVSTDLLRGRGGALVLTSLGSDKYFQKSPLSPHHASACLAAVARLHAACWEDTSILSVVANRLSDMGGSYNLAVRNPKELRNMVASWDHFRSHFRDMDAALFDRESVKSLGQRVYDNAQYISEAVSPKHSDAYATCVHGDFKAMNVFLPTPESGSEDAVLIDFASAGVGLGLSDVAMHVAHALRPEDLANGGEEALVDQYLSALDAERRRTVKAEDLHTYQPYPRDVAMRHYRLATVDYFRFILGRFWRSATPETFDKRKDSPNSTLVNRNTKAALAFVERVDRYLAEIEGERKSVSK